MLRNNGTTRRLAVKAFGEAEGNVRMQDENTYGVYLPKTTPGNWVALVKRYVDTRPSRQGGIVWGVQGSAGRFSGPTEAAAMWALQAGFISLPAGEHEDGGGSLAVTAFRAVANDVTGAMQDRVEPLTAEELVAVRLIAEALIAAAEAEWDRRQQG